MATKTFLLIGFLLSLIVLKPMYVDATPWHNCFRAGTEKWLDCEYQTCGGALLRWTFMDDIVQNCQRFCWNFFQEGLDTRCAQINTDPDTGNFYCACYEQCEQEWSFWNCLL
ncbi:uncharacterized protein LOC113340039 [Papaver somniferum]|uniref:uncharacterized protein LOC113340039 n=1 Tax=Papaver somniferum TaxID=3469 RepID=UPI000E6F4AE7|nr:uncharacterized protein LOC113340039 [Papaver somniferum]